MKINLTKEDCHNVQVSLISTAKSVSVDSNSMKALLTLSDKFIWVSDFEEPKNEPKQEIKK